MGIGTDNVYLINTDDIGKMDANHLGNCFATKSLHSSFVNSSLFLVFQKVKFCALKAKVLCLSWSRLLQVTKEHVLGGNV